MTARSKNKGTLVQVGEVFAARYRIVARIAAGGMGVVFEAYDQQVDRPVALKVMAVSRLHDPAAPARFKREARALASVDHPGVVTVHDYGEHEGHLYLVMALVRGGDLAGRLAGHRRLTPERTMGLAHGIADALDAVHAQGLVHRDIKPSNVLLKGNEERPVLCDFGLAKPSDGSDQLTATGQAPGTVQYMSPEQLRNDPVTASSDIYAFGCLLFHCLTGRPPYTGADAIEVMHGHLEGPLPDARAFNAQLPAAVQDVLARCLDKVPARRWRTARAVADGLQQAFSPASTQALQPDRTARLSPPSDWSTADLTAPLPVARQPRPRPADADHDPDVARPPLPRASPSGGRSDRLPRGLLLGCAGVLLVGFLGGGAYGLLSGTGADAEPTAGGNSDAGSGSAADGLGGRAAPGVTLTAEEQALAERLVDGFGDCSPLERSPGQLAKLNCDRTPEGIATLHIAQYESQEAMAANYRALRGRRQVQAGRAVPRLHGWCRCQGQRSPQQLAGGGCHRLLRQRERRRRHALAGGRAEPPAAGDPRRRPLRRAVPLVAERPRKRGAAPRLLTPPAARRRPAVDLDPPPLAAPPPPDRSEAVSADAPSPVQVHGGDSTPATHCPVTTASR
jgi:serine/threonine-protein kinase